MCNLINTYIHTYIHTYMCAVMCNLINIHAYILIPPWEDQCEWHRMTRMRGPDCAVICNLINIHTYVHTYIHTYCLERLCSQLAYASGVLSRLDILMSYLLLAVSDVLSLTTIYIISSTVLVVLSSTG